MDISKTVKGIQNAIGKHSPEILTGIGIAGMVMTVVVAVKMTPKALCLIDNEKEEKSVDKLTPGEVIRVTWKCYIPAVITGGLSVACLVGASSVNLRRNAALATAYALSESALKEYREKVIETFGEKKEKTVRDAVAKNKLEKEPLGNREVIIAAAGNTLCFDAISGRYFKSDRGKLEQAVNILNRDMLDEMFMSLNEFYYAIGLSNTKLGDELGWRLEDGLIDLNFSTQLADDGTPCLVLDYNIVPRYNFNSGW